MEHIELTELQANKQAIEQQLEGWRADLVRLKGAPFVNEGQVHGISEEIRLAEEKLERVNEEIEKLEGAGIKAQEELFSQFDKLQVGEEVLTLREMCVSEQHYQFLSAWMQQYVGDLAQTHATIDASHKSQIESLTAEVAESDEYRKQAMEYKEQLADMEMRRNAAAAELKSALTELAEAKEETKRLAHDNESLRKQLEAKAQPLHTNLNTNLAELAKELNAQKPAIYDVRWSDEFKKTHYLAKSAETGKDIWPPIPYLEIGKYRQLKEDEASRFREEYEAKQAAEAAAAVVQDIPLVVPPFYEGPFDKAPSVDGYQLDQEDVGMGMAGEAVTREEFQELTRKVYENAEKIAQIEQSQRSVA